MGFYRIIEIGIKVFDELVEAGDVFRTRFGRHEAMENAGPRRVTLVQFGNYAAGYWQFENGGSETYYAQKYTVDFIASLVTRADIESVTIVSFGENVSAVTLPNGVRTIGVELYLKGQRPRHRQLLEVVRETNPTHLIVNVPSVPLIQWGIRDGIPVLPMFADSFRAPGLKAALRHKLLATLLNDPAIEIVSNHNLAASLDLKRIGVDPRKIVPFDWPPITSPHDYEPKSAPLTSRPFKLLYVGSVIEMKGVGDAIRALSILRKRGGRFELTIIGRGEQKKFESLALEERLETSVHFLGLKSHDEVLAAMRDHDAVLVPSHWAYPEGLPMTLYEALCTRTPLVTSNHPMFALKIRNRQNAIVFPEKDPKAFADCIDELASTPELYYRLSNSAADAAEDYLCAVKYDQMISDFLSGTGRDRLLQFSLANHCYPGMNVADRSPA